MDAKKKPCPSADKAIPVKEEAPMPEPNQDAWRLPPNLPDILLAWYAENARPLPWRQNCLPYQVWLSEIMLQQTRAEVVRGYFSRFLREVPTLEALAGLDEGKLLKLWEGLGYYSRARNLQKTARLIVDEHGGQFPQTYAQLLKLPGIGPYTAGAITSICFNQPQPAVDGNVLRIIARIAGITDYIDSPAMQKRITAALAQLYPKERSGAFSQSLMELGATICLPHGMPKCRICPVAAYCRARELQAVARIPRKQDKKSKRIESITVLVLACQEKLAIRRRQGQGLLAGLWEFPNINKELSEQQAFDLAEQWGAAPTAMTKFARHKHIFTHIKWEMGCYYLDCAVQPSAFTWADQEALRHTYALPTAFKMLLP